jgi:hypothetical protein
MITTGRMAKAERKKTIWPTLYFSPRNRTKADMTANSKAETSLSKMALRTCMGSGRVREGRIGRGN